MLDLLNSLDRTVALTLLGGVGLVLLLLLAVSIRNRIIAKMGVRNIPRRPAQSVLIVLGLTLSTVIIVSALVLGDTLSYSLSRQAVDAYGQIDEVLAPPLLGTLAQLGIQPGDDGELEETPDLLAGGITSVIALFADGLPGIDESRYQELRTAAEEEPLIDGVAPAILFPTIIRNRTTGQGEPYGFMMGVDEAFPQDFGMVAIDGSPVDPTSLRPGVGNLFDLSANLFAAAGSATQNLVTIAGGNGEGEAGGEGIDITELALGAAAIGGAMLSIAQDPIGQLPLSEDQPVDPNQVEGAPPPALGDVIDLDQIADQLGVDAQFLEEQLQNLGINPQALDPEAFTDQFLNLVNLNTLGQDIDDFLGQAGLELRQGEVYLSRTGAERLKAQRGDLLDIYVGPIPVPYRVAGIVDQAGPPAALAPVVVMDMAEAQRLLFMEGRINSVLISNQGDELEGLALTADVQKRLRVLALDEAAAANLMTLLREPELRPALDRSIRNAIEQNPFEADEDDNAFLASFSETVGSVLGVADFSSQLRTIQASLDTTEITPDLLEALASRPIQFWLTSIDTLPSDRILEIGEAVSQLSQLELVEPLSKEAILTVADVGGSFFSSIFWFFGFFSILCGILLIFMIFVMLAAERRSEMGMARAVGMQRRQLVQMFVTEGVLYDLVAAAVGLLLGLAVSYAMIGYIGNLFGNVADSLNDQIEVSNILNFRFQAAPTSLIIAYCIGVLLTFVVVTYSSIRVSRLNIVAAVRDLPEENFSRRISWFGRILRFLAGPALIGLGVWQIWDFDLQQINRLQLSSTALVIGIAFFLGWLLSWREVRTESRQRTVYSIIGLGLLIIWVTPWSRWIQGEGAIFDQDPVSVLLSFALSGPLILLGAILTVIFNADAFLWGINRLLGGIGALTPVLRTAIAYPLSTRFRTGMAMLLFALVITTVVIMAVVIQATQTVVTPSDERFAGFEIQVSYTLLSFFNRIDDLEAEIERATDFPTEQVAAVGRVSEANLQLSQVRVDGSTAGVTQYTNVRVAGINPGLASQLQQYYTFQMRAPGFESDEAIWEALRSRSDVAIVMPGLVRQSPEDESLSERLANIDDDDDFGGRDGGRFDRRYRLRNLPGVTLADDDLPPITLVATDNRENAPPPVDVRVIAVLDRNVPLLEREMLVNDRLLERLEGDEFVPDSFYIKVAEGASIEGIAEAVERTFTSGGLNATLLAETFAAGQSVARGVLRLFQGFLALGLLVGIAALGVISSRTVVERRQQVGMLRAIGYQPHMVALSFLLEASFIALGGILIGTITGIVLGQNIVGEFFVFIAGETIPIPWGQIGVILLLAYGASLLTTVLPAIQASRIYPAEALRYE
ncbi:MAG: FtsX-like permease family protein [Chloroflexota bacterium]